MDRTFLEKSFTKKRNKKAQIVTTDLFIAVVIFTILMSIIVVSWGRYTTKLDDKLNYEEMQIRAFQISNLLVKSNGNPSNWENGGNIESLGLAARDRILSSSKVDAFVNLSYGNITKLLGIRNYDFYFKLKDSENNSLALKGNIPSGDFAVSLRRYVIYENEDAVMEFTLWK